MGNVIDFQQRLSPRAGLQWLGFAVIFFFVLIVYSPSLKHTPRAEQVSYLYTVAHQKTLRELVTDNYDMNRTGSGFAAGDEETFRPILYAFLGLEKYLFGYNFLLWQMAGILLHGLVIFWFLKICLEFHAGLPAVFMAFLFALFPANMDMVTWHHISSYLFAFFLVLVVIDHSFKLINGCGRINERVAWICVALVVGIFIYDIISVYALIVFFFLWYLRPDIRTKLPILVLPVVLYALTSFFNFFFVHHLNFIHRAWWDSSFLWNAFQTAVWWFYAGWFYYLYPLAFGIRTIFYPQDMFVYKWAGFLNPAVIATVIFLACLFLFMALNKATFWRKRISLIGMLLLFIIFYIFIIAFGRGHGYGVFLYYQYLFWLLLMLLFFISIDWDNGAGHQFFSRGRGIFMLAMLLVALGSGHAVFLSNYKRALLSRPGLDLVQKAEKLIKDKSGESDFSFYVAPSAGANPVYSEGFAWRGDSTGKRYTHKLTRTYMSFLYPQYFKYEGAKYRLEVR